MFAEYVLYKKHDNNFYSCIKRDCNLFRVFELLFKNGDNGPIAIIIIAIVTIIVTIATIFYDG
jgi:hypothetical protein